MSARRTPPREPLTVDVTRTPDESGPYDTEPMPADPTLVDAHPPVSDDGGERVAAGGRDRRVETPKDDEDPDASSEFGTLWVAFEQSVLHPDLVRTKSPHSDGGKAVSYATTAAPAKAAFPPDPSRTVVVQTEALAPKSTCEALVALRAPWGDTPTVLLPRARRGPSRAAGFAALASLLVLGAAAAAPAWWRPEAKRNVDVGSASTSLAAAAPPATGPAVADAEPDAAVRASAVASSVAAPAVATRPLPSSLRPVAPSPKPVASPKAPRKGVDLSQYSEEP